MFKLHLILNESFIRGSEKKAQGNIGGFVKGQGGKNISVVSEADVLCVYVCVCVSV